MNVRRLWIFLLTFGALGVCAADPQFRLRPDAVACECRKTDEYVTRVVIADSVPSEQLIWVKMSVPWIHVTFDRSKTPTRLLIDIICPKIKPGEYREQIVLQRFDGLRFVDSGLVIPVAVKATR